MSKFPCSRCGACCRSVAAVPEAMREGIISANEKGECVHLRKDNTCDVYETRPRVCRMDAGISETFPADTWYRLNLLACDALHRNVYGTPRIPMVE